MENSVWEFNGPGCFPKHLPDAFDGSVKLSDLTDIPSPVQGVYHEDGTFWGNGAPGCTLEYLNGGDDYLVCVTQACSWEIPLILAEIVDIRYTRSCKLGSTEIIVVQWKNVSCADLTCTVRLIVTMPNGSSFIRQNSEITASPGMTKESHFSIKFDSVGTWTLTAELWEA